MSVWGGHAGTVPTAGGRWLQLGGHSYTGGGRWPSPGGNWEECRGTGFLKLEGTAEMEVQVV